MPCKAPVQTGIFATYRQRKQQNFSIFIMANEMPRPQVAQSKEARLIVNNFEDSQELRIEVTGDAQSDSGKILIFGSAVPKQTGYGSDATLTKENAMVKSSMGSGSYPELQDYATKVGFVVQKITMQVSGANGVDNYDGKMVQGDLQVTGRTRIKDVELSDYRKEVGNGYNSVLSIEDQPLAVNGNTFLALSNVKAGTKITIRMTIGRVQRGVLGVAE